MLGIGFTYNEQPTFSSDRFAFRTPWFYGSLYLQFLKDKSKMIKFILYLSPFILFQAMHYPPLGLIIRRHFHTHPIPGQNLNVV